MIDWDKIPLEYEWAAMDKGGEWYAYIKEPRPLNTMWNSSLDCWLIPDIPSEGVDWLKSLIKRNCSGFDGFFKL